MPGGEIQNIEIKQKEILGLKGPKKAKDEIVAYAGTFGDAVDEVQNVMNEVQSQEAQDYIMGAADELADFLSRIAETGREIIKAHMAGKGREAPTLESLSSGLRLTLNKQKNAISSFRSIETFEKTIGEISKKNERLDLLPAESDPADPWEPRRASP